MYFDGIYLILFYLYHFLIIIFFLCFWENYRKGIWAEYSSSYTKLLIYFIFSFSWYLFSIFLITIKPERYICTYIYVNININIVKKTAIKVQSGYFFLAFAGVFKFSWKLIEYYYRIVCNLFYNSIFFFCSSSFNWISIKCTISFFSSYIFFQNKFIENVVKVLFMTRVAPKQLCS